MSCDLDTVSLTVTFCRTDGDLLLSAREHRRDFTVEETKTISRIAEMVGGRVRWEQRSIKDHAHAHIESPAE